MEVEFELHLYPSLLEEMCKECGERSLGAIGAPAYRERAGVFLDYFIKKVLQKHKRDSIRAIVVSGEVSAEWTTELGEMARRGLGTETAKIMTEIDPSEVVAHGAAWWARVVTTSPTCLYARDVKQGSR